MCIVTYLKSSLCTISILHAYQSLSTASIWHWWPLCFLSRVEASSVEIGNLPVSRDSFPGFSSITSLHSSQINCWNIISNIYGRTQYKNSFLRNPALVARTISSEKNRFSKNKKNSYVPLSSYGDYLWTMSVPTAEKILKEKDGRMLRGTLIEVSPESSSSALKNIGRHSWSPIYDFSLPKSVSKTPFLFSFFSTFLKHLEHKARKFPGLLSFLEPLICSKKACVLPCNLILQLWHRWWAFSRTVCLILIVKCSYLVLSTLSPDVFPKKDNP